jgi:ABC-type thiamine transport system ATPase subunit
VFQQSTLLPWAKVLDNVLLPIRTLKRDVNAGRRRALELLKLVGLERFQAHYPHELAVGRQQRVNICPRPDPRPRPPAHGRAVLRARRNDPRAHDGRAAVDAEGGGG